MKAKKLTEIDVEEISLVDVPAIRTRFVIVKDGKSFEAKIQDGFHKKIEKEVNKMDELIKILKEATGADLSEKQIEALKALSKEEIKEFTNSLDIVKGYKEDLPKELNETLAKLTKFAVREQPEPKVPEITEEQKAEIIEAFEKTGKKLSKDTLNVIESVVKKLDGLSEIRDALANLLPEDTQKNVKKTDDKDKKVGDAVVNVTLDTSQLKAQLEKLGDGIKESVEKYLEERVAKSKVKWPSFEAEDEE